MKQLYFFFLFFVLSQFVSAQVYTQKVDEKLQLLDKSEITTDILYDRIFPMAKLVEFNQTSTDTSKAIHFFQAYSEIQRADYNNRWQTAQNLALDVDALSNAIPIGILNVDFEYLDEEVIADNLLDIQGPDSLLVDVPNRPRSPYVNKNALVISPMLFDTKSLTVNFVTGNNFTLQAANVSINSLQADFGNGQGYQNISLTGTKSVTFNSIGVYTIKFKINLSNSSVKYAYAKIRVNDGPRIPGIEQPSKSPGTIDFCTANENTVTEITAAIGFKGYNESHEYYGTGTFAVHKGGSGFDKPVIVLDGFDPFEGNEAREKNVLSIYNSFLEYNNYSNIGDDLQSQGYDIVPLNFEKREAGDGKVINGGTDYIERNAMVLVRLLKGINNSSCWQLNKPIKIIGFSMGGLVARYALRYMELNNIQHNTNLFISVDSPHKGAVVPMGLQYTADFEEDLLGGVIEDIANIFGSDFDAGRADRALKSPAAKQMLKHHYLSGSKTPAGAPGFHDRFYNTLNAMGWPQQTRNIAVVNGVATGTPINSAGGNYLNAELETGMNFPIGVGTDIKLDFSPDRGQTEEVARFRFKIRLLFWDVPIWTRSKEVTTLSTKGSYENSPGGYFDDDGLLENFLGTDMEWENSEIVAQLLIRIKANISTSRFSFIPVKSALAYSGGNPDLYEDFSTRNLVCTGETPLDSYFTAQGGNQEHISLNTNSAKYIKNEITGTTRSPNVLTGDTELNGPEVLCGATVVYNIPTCGASVDSWSVSSNLQIINETSSYITVKPNNPNANNDAYIQANYSGAASIRKDVYIGEPSLRVSIIEPDLYKYTTVEAVVTGVNANINNQEITSTNVQEISSTGSAYITIIEQSNKFIIRAEGTSNNWSKWVKFTATNACGTFEASFRMTPPAQDPDPCNYIFESTDVNVYSIVAPPEPCGNPASTTTSLESGTISYNVVPSPKYKKITISVYNFSGILLLETNEKIVDLNSYKNGIYILKAKIEDKTYTKKVLKN